MRYTACLSTQVGCAMNCQFCYTGRMGLLGNLSAAQIVEQVRAGEAWGRMVFRLGYLSAAQIVEQVRAMFCCPHHEAGEGSLPPPARATLPVPIDPSRPH